MTEEACVICGEKHSPLAPAYCHKTIIDKLRSQVHEQKNALTDIADILDLPEGQDSPRDIVGALRMFLRNK